MVILHSADWHIGQTLNGWSRSVEHRAFLARLATLARDEAADALLVAGDVFDGLNPSGEAMEILYAGIAALKAARPALTVVMIAGNHDPAGRLEAPDAVLRLLGVHVVGTLARGPGGAIDLDRHLLPLRDGAGVPRALVLALPFLRAGDLPGLTLGAEGGGEGGGEGAVAAATRALLSDLGAAAAARAGGLPVILTAHLTCAGGLASEGAERRILIGGAEAVPPDAFPPAFALVALGHLHRPQTLGDGRIRYAGSPFPLSATEIGYDHGVTRIALREGALTLAHRPVPRAVAMHRLPEAGAAPLAAVAAALAALPLDPAAPPEARPFVHLALAADRPAAQLQAEAEAIVAAHPVRLAGLRIEHPAPAPGDPAPPPARPLSEIAPEDLFAVEFRRTHGIDPGPAHLAAFRDALSEV